MSSRAGIEGRDIPAVIQERVSRSLGIIGRSYDAARTGWFGPGAPPQPSMPPGSPVRVWEYQPGYNIAGGPRTGTAAGISFQQLRALADNYDLLRLVIETVKNKIEKMPWTIRPKQQPGETALEAKKRNDDPRILELREFFRKPDKRRTWKRWLRRLLEEILVIDAPAIYLKPSLAGTLYGLQIIDGATIRPLLDEQGEIAAYQQWLYGLPAKQFNQPEDADAQGKGIDAAIYSPQELLYLPINQRVSRVYGFSPVEQIVITVNLALRRQYQQIAFYTKGNIPEGFFEAPESWSPAQIELFQKNFDSYMQGNLDARSGMVMLPSGAKPLFPKIDAVAGSGEKTTMDDWLASLVAYTFGVSRNSLIKPMNRASAEQGAEEAEEEGLEPLISAVADILNLIIEDVFGYDDIEFAADTHREVDALKQAQIFDLAIKNGSRSIDEVREANGDEPIGMGPGILTLSGFVPFPVGGSAEILAAEQEKAKNPPPAPGQKLIGDGKTTDEPSAKEPAAKKRHYAADSPHVILDRLARLEKKAASA